MKDFAIAISVYDKFTDVKILTDIIRRNWQGDFYIVVCSSHRNPYPHLKDCDIDELHVTENVPFDPATYTGYRRQSHITLRTVDSVRKSCSKAAESSAPYTIHIHADCIPLSWPRLKTLSETMRQQGQVFAGRGYGFGIYQPDIPVGHLDDMFFVVDNEFARTRQLWNFDLLDFLPHKLSVHGFLAFLVLSRVGLRKFWFYSQYDEGDDVTWDGRPVTPYLHNILYNPSLPLLLNSKYGFLHIHETAFGGDLGLRIRAHYLKTHGLTRGPVIEDYLRRYDMDSNVLFQKLRQDESALSGFFAQKGLSRLAEVTYGRNPVYLRKIRDQYQKASALGKTRWLAQRHAAQLKNVAREFLNAKFRGNPFGLYWDTVWPKKLEALYGQALDVPADIEELNLFHQKPSKSEPVVLR